MNELVSPLYPPEGAPCLGFCCRVLVTGDDYVTHECRALFKTEHYVWLHIASVHGIKREPELPGVEKANPEAVLSDISKIALDASNKK